MALGSQLPVRLDPEVDKRLEHVAGMTGTTKSALIRMLAKTFVDQCVAADGSVTLPADWKKLLGEADGRSVQLKRKVSSADLDPAVVRAARAAADSVPDSSQDKPRISRRRVPKREDGQTSA